MPSKKSSNENAERELREITALVTRLLSHYWTADDREESREAQVEDWIDDLREFGPVIVRDACAEWRRGSKVRPTPADIRKLAVDDQRERQQWGRSELKKLDGPQDRDTWARSLGWSSWLERQDAIAANEMRYAIGAYGIRANDETSAGRAKANAWAKERGFDDIDAYAQAKGIHWSQAYVECINEILKNSPLAKGMKEALKPLKPPPEFNPTPEEMAASRKRLGIPEPPDKDEE